jgi:hypothetical protein
MMAELGERRGKREQPISGCLVGLPFRPFRVRHCPGGDCMVNGGYRYIATDRAFDADKMPIYLIPTSRSRKGYFMLPIIRSSEPWSERGRSIEYRGFTRFQSWVLEL